ncbi:UPF0235 protein C15orf40 homolog [Macrosteles quadrilineatus]|uniref:UPF0235 protein C15orf40 homolog n=1 Tax=Macrosteles quadrilineatus TaxID=74068 RepID=UPI0023E13399|nr:UPF0235 protein C15orf40 homolog [Macrosteles quadrilineatus]
MIGACRIFTRQFSKYFPEIGRMSKSKVQKSKNKNNKNEENPPSESPSGPVSARKDGNISIKILAKPGAKTNNITDIGEEAVGVQISAPPVEGEANTELVRYMSGVLGLRKSDVTLDKGSRSRQKTILLQSGTLSVSEVIAKLKSAMDS